MPQRLAARSAVVFPVVRICITREASTTWHPRSRPLRISDNANRIRLWAIVGLFRLSPSAIAKATGFSRPYVARLLSRKDDFTASPEFWRVLECKLGTIIDQRASQVFTCSAVSVVRARRVLEGLPEQVEDVVPTLERAVDRLFPETAQSASVPVRGIMNRRSLR